MSKKKKQKGAQRRQSKKQTIKNRLIKGIKLAFRIISAINTLIEFLKLFF